MNDRKHFAIKKEYYSFQKNPDGFGLIEAMIAGVILLFTMTAIGRFTQAAMSSGANQEIRTKLENRIMDNIQEIHQQDSRLTWEIIEDLNDEQEACSNPAQYTKNKIETSGSGYYVETPKKIVRKITDSSDVPGIIIVTYSFDGPENSVGIEKRIVELSPTFAADCFDLGSRQ